MANHRDTIINAQIDQALADERLRDAAPELLAALKGIFPRIHVVDPLNPEHDEEYQAVLKAIAKAEVN